MPPTYESGDSAPQVTDTHNLPEVVQPLPEAVPSPSAQYHLQSEKHESPSTSWRYGTDQRDTRGKKIIWAVAIALSILAASGLSAGVAVAVMKHQQDQSACSATK